MDSYFIVLYFFSKSTFCDFFQNSIVCRSSILVILKTILKMPIGHSKKLYSILKITDDKNFFTV
ncbi:hypothetical protein LEP1GSC070_1593 [Leptospira santarosai str. AIM]|nr:hypothetical protein LEP1GSC070_1593 [Leptospira santarosai str. AIM]